jgi:hypothetical protein
MDMSRNIIFLIRLLLYNVQNTIAAEYKFRFLLPTGWFLA